jgi:hypothetical protein
MKLLYAFEDSEAYSSFFVQEKAKPFFIHYIRQE